jgi:hypothetical protein
MGGSDGARPIEHATDPPPRAFMVARTERSPGFGTPLAFPVSQWRFEWSSWPMRARYPLQWRGRAGIAPASEQAPFVLLQLFRSGSLSARFAGRKGCLQLGLESSSLLQVGAPL